jgi:transposase
MFREVSVVEAREVLRLWLMGHSQRESSRLAGVNRKTGDRYLKVARAAGLTREGGLGQLTDELLGEVLGQVRPGRPGGHGQSWGQLEGERGFLAEKLDEGLRLTKVHELLGRRGVMVPYRTLHRFCVAELEFGQRRGTVRVVDGEPGHEVQVDFGRMGMVHDALRQQRRWVWGLVFTAVFSRHLFCWLTFEQTTAAVIAGCEEAWGYFGGVFRVLIPDNLTPVVVKADRVAPHFNTAFQEYAQSRGFVIDAARAGHPTDKPRVERQVPYCRESGFRGESFTSFEQARAHMVKWGLGTAGMRVHGTTQRRPREHFEAEERHLLLPAPSERYDPPIYARPKVARDRHIEVGKALYSVPDGHIGHHVDVRADRHLVRISLHGQVIKVHPRKPPGGRSTDPEDLPEETRAYAMRDLDYLRRVARGYGEAVGAYTDRLLDSPLPWTKMRQVYRLHGLARRYGQDRVNQACQRALDLDVVDVTRISRMLERALEAATGQHQPRAHERVIQLRFARSDSEFGLAKEGDRYA